MRGFTAGLLARASHCADLAFPVFPWRQAELLLEGPVKGAGAGKAGLKGDFGDRKVGVPQKPGGLLHPQGVDVFMEPHPQCHLK